MRLDGRGGPLHLQWYKCAGEWCLLDNVNPIDVDAHGVFVIWRPGVDGRAPVVLFVGRGALRREIDKCRRDPLLGNSSDLRITWATVDPRDVDGVAAFRYQQLRPLWGQVPAPGLAQPVNLPLTA